MSVRFFNSIFFVVTFALILLISASCEKDDPKPNDDNSNNNNVASEVFGGGNFDNWITVNQGDVSFEKPQGNWWGSLNSLSFLGGPITLTKTDDAYSGSYAARLETKMWGDDLSIPGIMASGYFDKEMPIGENLLVGQAFDKKPTRFTGYYKYYPQDNDSLIFLLALTKFNNSTGIRDTVAQTDMVCGNTVTEYTMFDLQIEYFTEQTPDSIHVIFLSSYKGEQMQGNPGSTLYIDKLNLTY